MVKEPKSLKEMALDKRQQDREFALIEVFSGCASRARSGYMNYSYTPLQWVNKKALEIELSEKGFRVTYASDDTLLISWDV